MSKRTQTIEEFVKEALVPEEEQPYEVPKNWVWVRMGEVVKINPPKPKLDLPNEQFCSFLPMGMVNPETGRIDSLEEREFEKVKKGYTYFEENDVLFAKITPCMENGNTVIAKGLKNEFGFGSTEFYVLRTSEHIDERYAYYLLRTEKFRKQAKMEMTGAVGQQRVPKKFLEMYPLALPPLNEQKRIAKKVERLLDKIKEAKQLIEEANETFELRRAAILDKVFRGKLGTNIASEKSIISIARIDKFMSNEEQPYEVPENWVWASIGDIFEFENGDRSSNYPKNAELVEIGIPFISTKNLVNNQLDLSNLSFISQEKFDSLRRGKLRNHDLVMSLRGSIGKIGVFTETEDYKTGFINAQLIILRIKSIFGINNSFFYLWYMSSKFFQNQLINASTGSAQPQLSASELRKLLVPLPPINEQKRIVEKVNGLLKKSQKQQVLIQETMESLEIIKQSILSKAFRGELGTNDPSEENAIELLKEVLQEQVK
ncbi:restriction endonuclease subunit S [Bacillus pacificus]|uniref:restriction endonuclease subunit S n=1 Tax=Bacillus pacificus TaxID=2026187 RepID=UPI002E1C04B7|nr:restriction endonuclease subunit S [Bacillus pacificus]